MKSKVIRWYKRHNQAIDAVIDIAFDAIPGAGIVKKTLKLGKAAVDGVGDHREKRLQELENILSELKPLMTDLVEDVEDLKTFQDAATTKQARIAIEDSELKEELNELMPQLSESISRSVTMLSNSDERVINRKYQIIERVGKGGQGEVYKARHLMAETNVAIKILPHELSEDATAVASLKQEYQRLVKHLSHPSIVQYRDLDQDWESGCWFIVMDYVDGKNLRHILLERKQNPLSLVKVAEILKSVAQALDFSHGNGIIHCDLKPENIMIDEDGSVFLTDFGLAYEVQTSLSIKGTISADINGTLPYMSPEQYKGRRIRPATDIWALGVIFYEMIEGCHPFKGRSFEHFRTIICEYEMQSAENLSPLQSAALLKMMEKDPMKRPGRAEKAIFAIIDAGKPTIYANHAVETRSAEQRESPEVSLPMTSKLESSLEYKDFLFLRKKKYSCGGVSHEVEEYQHRSTGIEFVLIPSGSFMRGEKRIFKHHQVRVKEFLMAKYPVTQKQWEKVMENNPSKFKGANCPVEQISWSDAKKFCAKLGLRLPSEAQWEYACRAGTTTEYFCGDNADSNYMHYSESKLGKHDGRNIKLTKSTIDVGSKKPNAFGLYDMSGNVSEWCEDEYEEYDVKYFGTIVGGSEWTPKAKLKQKENKIDGSIWTRRKFKRLKRVLRGGSWSEHPSCLRSAERRWYFAKTRSKDAGFRVSFSS